MGFEVRLHPHAVKFLQGLDGKSRGRVRQALEELGRDPFRPRSGSDILKLQGTRGRRDLYRLRVGKFRVVYEVEEEVIWVTDVFERGRGYRGV